VRRGASPRVAALLLGLGALIATVDASATPTRWELARDPRAYADDRAAREAEQALLAQARVQKGQVLVPAEESLANASRAREILVEADAPTSPRGYLRMLLGQAYYSLHRFEEAAATLETVVNDPSVPLPLRASTQDDLAIAYARLGRVDEEIAAYDAAIALDPLLESRALYLSNQAEAFMVKGDTRRAVLGYRAALDGLGQFGARELAPTTLWSLGVALDRSGDLDGALDSIALARGIDPNDTKINGDTWFFVPEYDAAYYAALGHWLVARRSSEVDIQMAAYERSILSWKEYLLRAPESDRYRPMATARLRAATVEYDAFAKKARTPTLVDPEPRRGAR
jgi:tetratricopeptide (TPR) repeat protein